MKITQITVSYQETCSLPEYSNIRPSLTLTAELAPGDDPAAIWAGLLDEARRVVRAEIDDALEAHGKRTKYYDGPRLQLLNGQGTQRKLLLLMPDDRNDWPDGWTHARWDNSRGLRPDYARALAARLAKERGGEVIDCSDGDLRKVPTERPFDEEDAREQENTSEVYRQAMGWTSDDGPDNSM